MKYLDVFLRFRSEENEKGFLIEQDDEERFNQLLKDFIKQSSPDYTFLDFEKYLFDNGLKTISSSECLELDLAEVEEDIFRLCWRCEKRIQKGYVVDKGEEYYCSENCLFKSYSPSEWKEMCKESEEGENDINYYTEWESIYLEDS